MSDDLSAYQDLMTALATRREHRSAARDDLLVRLALNKHAHELAEKIRTELPERVKKLTGNWAEIRTVSTAQHAADLIDPEVLNSE